MGTLLQDLRYAGRTLLKAPVFTAVVVATLALGIGATTTIFSLANTFFLRPLPGVESPGQVMDVWGARGDEGHDSGLVLSYPVYEEYRERTRAFEELAAFGIHGFSLSTEGPAERIAAMVVTPNYFSVLGTRPAHGRFFHPGDAATPGADAVVVLSYELWQRHFGGDPGVVGQTVVLSGQPVTVIGVAPRGFTGTVRLFGTEAWMPISLYPLLSGRPDQLSRGATWIHIFGRLRPGVTPAQAQSEMNLIAQQLEREVPDPSRPAGVALSRLGGFPGEGRTAVLGFTLVLLVVSGLVLVIACTNVAGMLLARASVRRREIAVRLALGAGRGRLVRQLLTESTLLFLLGGLAGVAVAVWASRLLLAFRPPIDIPLHLDLTLDARVLGFALALSLFTGLLFGLMPALQGSDLRLVSALKEGAAGEGRRRSRLRSAHVIAQVAFSLLLLIAAGLFLRALQRGHSVDPGFNPAAVLVATFDLEIQGYDAAASSRFFTELVERASALPQVEAASLSWLIPLSLTNATIGVQIEGEDQRGGIGYNVVGPGYFSTLQISLLRGRDFSAADREGSAAVAIISEAMARRFWPDEDPLGKVISTGQTEREIVGVVRNSKHGWLGEEPQPFLYLPYAQAPRRDMTLYLRTAGDPLALLPALRREAAVLDPHVPVLNPAPLARVIGVSLLPQRMAAAVTGVLGVLGMLLAAIGLYGLIAYSVSQRVREIGVRMALGARARDVLGLVVGQGLRLTLIGVGIGMLAAFGATRLLSSFLFGISATDPITFVAVPLLLAGVALLAAYLPARRATRVDPMVALRSE